MVHRIGICDKDACICEQLEQNIRKFYNTYTCQTEVSVWYTGEGCCSSLRNDTKIDILFLEQNLPGKSGIEVGRYIRKELQNNIMHIIFISASPNNLLKVFQVHPYDFLIKPITQHQIFDVLEKLLFIDEQDRRYFTYVSRKSLNKIPYGEIQYLSSNNRHIEIHLKDGNMREFNGCLKNKMDRLPDDFVRIAQSYIINLKYVKKCKYDSVMMMNGDVINISQPNRKTFRDKLSAYYEEKM